AKIIVCDRTRADAIQRMRAALDATVILGTTTNLDFLRVLLAHPVFRAGEVDTGFIEAHGAALLADVPPVDAQTRDLALIAAALADAHSAPLSPTSGPAHHDPWSTADGFRGGAAR